MRNLFVLALVAGLLDGGLALARTPAANDAQVYFIWPQDGAVIHGGKFWVRMGLRNMGVAPKGTDVAGTGHHHLLIDTDLPENTNEPIGRRGSLSPARLRRIAFEIALIASS